MLIAALALKKGLKKFSQDKNKKAPEPIKEEKKDNAYIYIIVAVIVAICIYIYIKKK
jgi:hypothetical protein